MEQIGERPIYMSDSKLGQWIEVEIEPDADDPEARIMLMTEAGAYGGWTPSETRAIADRMRKAADQIDRDPSRERVTRPG